MNDLIGRLRSALDGEALGALADQLGVDRDDAAKAVRAAIPALVEQLDRNADDPDEAESIARAVADDHDGSVLDDAARALGSYKGGPGAKILRHVFGDEVDRVVAKLSAQTGLPPGVVEGALTAVAPLAMGAITKAAIGAVTAATVVAVLNVARKEIESGRAQQKLAALNARLDTDGDGNATDDVARRFGQLAGRGARNVADGARAFTEDERVRRTAKNVGDGAKTALGAGAREGSKLARRAAKAARSRWGKLFS